MSDHATPYCHGELQVEEVGKCIFKHHSMSHGSRYKKLEKELSYVADLLQT